MSFPITHILVADGLLTRNPRSDADAAQFLLGAIAPDAVHYREGLVGASQVDIGATKKIAHLCPVSDRRWGAETDNEGWIACAKAWARDNTGPLAEGYVIHVMTDIYTNMSIWGRFRTQHPDEAAKGYASDYYRDLPEIDLKLYQEYVQGSRAEQLLAAAKAYDMPGLVSAQEICAIRDNLLYENYKGRTPTPGYEYKFVTYNETLNFISEAVTAIERWQA